MGFIIGFLTFVLVLICIALILLVLIQLPKKDAGAGLAFGGGATDALFGAGSGNMLTKITKYFAGAFFVMAIGLGLLQSAFNERNDGGNLQKEIDRLAKQPAGQVSPPADVEKSVPAAAPAASNLLTTPTPAPTTGTNK